MTDAQEREDPRLPCDDPVLQGWEKRRSPKVQEEWSQRVGHTEKQRHGGPCPYPTFKRFYLGAPG